MATSKPLKPLVLKACQGVRNDVPAEGMTLNAEGVDLVVGANVDLDDRGGVSRRNGYVLAVAGTDMHSLFATADGTQALVIDGTNIKRVTNNGATVTTIGSGLTAGARMSYWEHQKRVYHCNGINNGVFEGGAVRNWGVRRPADPALAATGGPLPAGRYAVALTFVCNDGSESGAGPGSDIELAAAGGIAVNLTASTNARVTHINIYCTTPDGGAFYRAGTVANASQVYTIAAPPALLQSPLITQHFDKPPVGHLVAIYRGRAYVAVGDLLHWSSPYGLEIFKPTDYLRMGSALRMIAPSTDGMYLSSDEGTFWAGGVDPDKFTLLRVGEPALPGSVTYAKSSLVTELAGDIQIPVWLAGEGVCIGAPGGQLSVVNKKWRASDAASGAGLIRAAGDTYQYLVSTGA